MATLLKPYTTVERVQLETKNFDTAEDDNFIDAINDASRWVEDYCNRDFWYHDYSTTAFEVPEDWIVDDRIYLQWPIIGLTKIESDGVEVDSDTYRYQNAYSGKGTSEVIYNGGTSWNDWRSTTKAQIILGTASAPPVIELTGTFGYALDSATEPPPTCPRNVVRATTLIASAFTALWRREVIQLDGNKESLLDTRVQKQAMEMLRKWRWRVDI